MKIPEARQLESGSWFIQLRLGGESISITEDTKARCELVATQTKAAYKLGQRQQRLPANEMTLEQIVRRYIDDRRASCSPSTIRGYEQILSRFNQYKKSKTASIKWQRVFDEMAQTYSPKTLRSSWSFVASALKHSGCDVPSISLPPMDPPELPYLNAEQIKTFLEAIRDQPGELPALLALHSLRRSEICALTWDHVDLDQRAVKVSGAKVLGVDGYVTKSTNKNQSSKRTVPILIDRLYELLKATPEKNGFVITTHPNVLHQQINKVCKKAGLPLVGVHGLRRSFASLGYSLGIPERVIMAWGGWADYQTMHKKYIKLSQQDLSQWAGAMSGFFKGESGK